MINNNNNTDKNKTKNEKKNNALSFSFMEPRRSIRVQTHLDNVEQLGNHRCYSAEEPRSALSLHLLVGVAFDFDECPALLTGVLGYTMRIHLGDAR